MAETRSYEEIAKIAKKIQQEEENKMQFQVTRRMYETFSNEELQILANGSSDVSSVLDAASQRTDELKSEYERIKTEATKRAADPMEAVFDWMDGLPEKDIEALATDMFGNSSMGRSMSSLIVEMRRKSGRNTR